MIGRGGKPSMTRRFGPVGYWRAGGLGQTFQACDPFSAYNCPWYCLWAQTPECDISSTVRQASAPYYCSLPGSSIFSTCAYPSTSAPATAAAPSTSAQQTQPGAWTPDIAIQQTSQTQKQQMQDFMGNVSAANPPAAAPDCTNFWTALTNTSCWPDTNTVMWIAVAGVLVLILAMRK